MRAVPFTKDKTLAILAAVMNYAVINAVKLLSGLLLSAVAPLVQALDTPTRDALDSIPAPVQQVLRRQGLEAQGLSLFAQEIGAPTPILAVAADAPRNPASVMKLLTTLAVLEELGPVYVWKTEAYAVAAITQGHLAGDLYLKGYGDPYLVTEGFWQLLHGLRQRGLTDINGDLVLDGSHLQPTAEDPGDFDGQPLRAYNVGAAALMVNFQTINFRFLPDRVTRRLNIVADPHPEHIVIENRIRLVDGPCRSWRGGLGMQVIHMEDREKVRFTGSYAASCGERDIFRVLTDAARHVYGMFKALWAERGGRLDGGVREAQVPAEARLLYGVESRPLAEVLRGINKYSNNVMTRQLVLTLGAERMGAPGTNDKGFQAIRAWLQRRGLAFPELVLENGVGLSRIEKISARHLGELLLAGYNSPYMPEFVSSLPIAAVDGTLQNRFVGSPWAGRLHAKTGAISDVKSIAGYLLDRRGRRIAVVCLHNHAQADTRAGDMIQEAFLKWLYERP